MKLIPYFPITNQVGYAYVYKIVNTITGEFYYGSRYSEIVINSSTPEMDFWKKYFTTSNTVKKQIKQYGKSVFSTEIIFSSKSKEEVFLYEQEMIKQHTKNPKILNKMYISVDSNNKATKCVTKSDSFRLHISKVQKGRQRSEKEKYNSSMLQISKSIKNYTLTTLEEFQLHLRDLFFNHNMTALDIAKHLNLFKGTIHNHLSKYLTPEEKAWSNKRKQQLSKKSRTNNTIQKDILLIYKEYLDIKNNQNISKSMAAQLIANKYGLTAQTWLKYFKNQPVHL